MSGAFWRSTGPFMTLKEVCDIRVEWGNKSHITWADMADADIVYMHRPQSEIDVNLFLMAKDFGKPVWTDWDDNLFDIPWDNDTHTTYFDKTTRNRMKSMIAKSDHISVSTVTMRNAWVEQMKMFLQEMPSAEPYLKNFDQRISIIPNGMNPRWFKWRNTKDRAQKIRVLWRGSPHHKLDIEHVQGHVIKVINANPDVEFWMVGFRPWRIMQESKHANVIHAGAQMVNYYFKFLNKIRPDIQWTTLYDNNFNRCKSNIAQIEGAMAGAVSICPDWPEVWQTSLAYTYRNPNHFAEVLQSSIDECRKDRKKMNESADEVWNIFLNKPGIFNLDRINFERYRIIKHLTGITPKLRMEPGDIKSELLPQVNPLELQNESTPPPQT